MPIRICPLKIGTHNSPPGVFRNVKDKKSNCPTAGMRGTPPSKERSSKAVCGGTRRGSTEKTALSTSDWHAADIDFRVVGGGCAGTCAPLGKPSGGRGYHCTCWSKTYSGSGCASVSQSGRESSPSFHMGGPRTGPVRGDSAGSPIWLRILCTGFTSVMKATMHESPLLLRVIRCLPPNRGGRRRRRTG